MGLTKYKIKDKTNLQESQLYQKLHEDFIDALNDRIWCKENEIKYTNPNIEKAKKKFYAKWEQDNL